MRALLILSQQDLFLASWVEQINRLDYDSFEVASRAEDAIELLSEKSNFDLILCEQDLGGRMSGQMMLETLRLTGKLPYTTMFVLVTASVPKDFLLHPQGIKPDALIIKPYTGVNIYNSLAKALVRLRVTRMIRYWMDIKDFDKAIELCKKTEKNIVHKSWCRNAHAEMLFTKGKINETIELCTQELKENGSTETWALTMLVQLYLEKREYKKAFNLINDLPEMLKNNIAFLKLMAECYSSVGEHELATKLLNGAITACPDNMHLYFSHAKAARDSWELKQALSSMVKGINLSQNTVYETEERYEQLSEIAHDYCITNELKEADLITETRGLMSIGYSKFPHKEIFSISSQIFNIYAALYQGNKTEAVSLFELFFMRIKSIDDKETFQTMSKNILCLAQELPITTALKEMVLTWVGAISSKYSIKTNIRNIELSSAKQADVQRRIAIKYLNNNQYDEAEQALEKGILAMPGHVGINITLIQLYLDIMERNYRPIDRLINLCYRCFERINAPLSHQPYFEDYISAKTRIDQIAASKLRKKIS